LHRKSPTGQDPEAAERQMLLKQPAAGGESCKQDSFLYKDKELWEQLCCEAIRGCQVSSSMSAYRQND